MKSPPSVPRRVSRFHSSLVGVISTGLDSTDVTVLDTVLMETFLPMKGSRVSEKHLVVHPPNRPILNDAYGVCV